MLCKVCNTRVTRASSTCPNCGSAVAGSLGATGDSSVRKPALSPSTATDSGSEGDEGEELPLGTPTVDLLTEREPRSDEPKPEVPIRIEARAPETKLRALLAEKPESLESGLDIHTDVSGNPLGVGYRCEVGEIDLLARDSSGAFVVVFIADPGDGETALREILNRIGWVRKHLAKPDERVRGTVLLDRVPDDLSYLASAVADTVNFKTYRVALVFEDIDV